MKHESKTIHQTQNDSEIHVKQKPKLPNLKIKRQLTRNLSSKSYQIEQTQIKIENENAKQTQTHLSGTIHEETQIGF